MTPWTKKEKALLPRCCRGCRAIGYCKPVKKILKEIRKTLRQQEEMFAPCAGVKPPEPCYD